MPPLSLYAMPLHIVNTDVPVLPPTTPLNSVVAQWRQAAVDNTVVDNWEQRRGSHSSQEVRRCSCGLATAQ